jgi:hypothetical protein
MRNLVSSARYLRHARAGVAGKQAGQGRAGCLAVTQSVWQAGRQRKRSNQACILVVEVGDSNTAQGYKPLAQTLLG